MNTNELIAALQDADPTGELPVVIASGIPSTPDERVDSIINTRSHLILCPASDSTEDIPVVKFWVDTLEGDEGGNAQYIISSSVAGSSKRVGPPTFDMLVAEQVVRELYERVNEYVQAYCNGDEDEYVSSLFDEHGGP